MVWLHPYYVFYFFLMKYCFFTFFLRNITKYDKIKGVKIQFKRGKSMKKKVIAALLATVTILSFAGCGKFTCDMCGEEKSGKKHEETILGETITICDDCYKDLEDLANLLK